MAGLNDTPGSERIRIGFFGVRNAGKSSLVNAFTGQNLSIVSNIAGTTTDSVRKSMELLPLGPVVIIDTPGIDDVGELGALRIERARLELERCDAAVLVTDASRSLLPAEQELLDLFRNRKIPYVVACTKADLLPDPENTETPEGALLVSSRTGAGVEKLKETVAKIARGAEKEKHLLSDLLAEGDTVVLVIPIDGSAPKGRLILPQQMAIRDLLDSHIRCSVCQPSELQDTLSSFRIPPALVVTDSQAFQTVSSIVPDEIALTSFSILMARYRGSLQPYLEGVSLLGSLKDGDSVLISEGCTHHRQCEDIGTVKLPGWIRKYSGAEPAFRFTSGGEFPSDLSGIRLIVHCGGCMLNDKEMQRRISLAREAGVPIVNYGMAIAQMNGILERALAPLRK